MILWRKHTTRMWHYNDFTHIKKEKRKAFCSKRIRSVMVMACMVQLQSVEAIAVWILPSLFTLRFLPNCWNLLKVLFSSTKLRCNSEEKKTRSACSIETLSVANKSKWSKTKKEWRDQSVCTKEDTHYAGSINSACFRRQAAISW